MNACPQAPDGKHRYGADYFCICGELEPSARPRCNKVVGARGRSMRDRSGGCLCDADSGHGGDCYSMLLRRSL